MSWAACLLNEQTMETCKAFKQTMVNSAVTISMPDFIELGNLEAYL